MTIGPDEAIFTLFQEAVVCVDPTSHARRVIAIPDVLITSGIAIVGERLYFGSGPRLLSCAL